MQYLLDFLSYTPGKPFLFTSLDFWIFLCLTLGGFCLCYKNRKARNLFLFICSLFFYYKVGGYFIFILLLSIVLNYGIGIQIENSTSKGRKLWLTIGILTNLTVLGFFKYNLFFIRLFNLIFSTHIPETDLCQSISQSFLSLYASSSPDSLSRYFSGFEPIIPPIGISFMTLQAIGYLTDVKRGTFRACRNLGDFGFFLSFFPQLVAGPIVRARQFLPQLQRHYMLSSIEFSDSLILILRGLIKIMLIADYLAIHFTSPIFDQPLLYSGFENWMALYAFAIQIYCDFSGYTDIAIGVASLFGFQLPVNFRSPYKASSLTDFWRRWHISLSSWFRDYVYIPLGGNRKGNLVMVPALLITMILAGFWHGAGWGFLLWGALHGIALCLEKLTSWNRWVEKNRISRIIGWAVTFHIICFGWILFRCHSLTDANNMIYNILNHPSWNIIPKIVTHHAVSFSIMAVAMTSIVLIKERQKNKISGWFYKTPLWGKFLLVSIIAILLILSRQAEPQDFIHFQF